jgi:drug/metabolite transporter (DMT)-like permease
MRSKTLTSDALLLLTALIWGFAFVAQRLGMEHVGPLTFNGVRFALGSLFLCLVLGLRPPPPLLATTPKVPLVRGGALAGCVLFLGASLQQIGIVYTTAGKAGFITGLYVVIVPFLGLFWHKGPDQDTWVGAGLAAVGLYLLSVTEQFTIALGDLLVLMGAFCWAAHVMIIGWLSPRSDPLKLALAQYSACALLSLAAGLVFESFGLKGIGQAAVPIFYGGVFSVGIAYTLQVVAQQKAHPAHASILLSLEAVFAALGGWWILDERLSFRAFVGCGLMMAGMLISQLHVYEKVKMIIIGRLLGHPTIWSRRKRP